MSDPLVATKTACAASPSMPSQLESLNASSGESMALMNWHSQPSAGAPLGLKYPGSQAPSEQVAVAHVPLAWGKTSPHLKLQEPQFSASASVWISQPSPGSMLQSW